jgi:hypothetical protein
MDKARGYPGDVCLSPVFIVSLGILVVNDHWLKGRYHDAFTGKLSDAAGIVFFPLLLVAIVEVGRRLTARAPWALSTTGVSLCVGITALVFTLAKVTKPVNRFYGWATAQLEKPPLLLKWLFGGGHTPNPRVVIVHDPTDLVVLPLLVIPWLVARAYSRRSNDSRVEPLSRITGES